MSGKKSQNKNGKRKGGVLKAALRFAVLLIVLLFVAAAAFLQVETINIEGNHHESEDAVREVVLKRAPGNSLLLAWLLNNGRGAPGMPFVQSFDVSMADTKTLNVAVREKAAVGCFSAQEATWYFDAEGNLLFSQPVPEVKNEGHFIPVCEGIVIPKETAGGREKVLSSGMSLEIRKSIFEDIGKVQAWCQSEGVYTDLISFDENENMTILFGEVRVEMGAFGDISAKLTALTELIPEILGRSGTLDLKNYDGTQKDIYFF